MAQVTFPAGGRGVDLNNDGSIGSTEGLNAAPPRGIIRTRDGFRQTVVDLMQLVRVIEAGVDIDGDGVTDLDPARIYYTGLSLGRYVWDGLPRGGTKGARWGSQRPRRFAH